VTKKSKPFIAFASIDAKDDFYTGYSVAAYVGEDAHYGDRETGPKRDKLHMKLNREYLTRLAALQEELEVKYLPLFMGITTDPTLVPEEELYYRGMNREDYDKFKTELEAEFPGPQAAYYT